MAWIPEETVDGGKAPLPLLHSGTLPAQAAGILHYKAAQEMNKIPKQQRCACLLSLLLCCLSSNLHPLLSYSVKNLWIVFYLSFPVLHDKHMEEFIILL